MEDFGLQFCWNVIDGANPVPRKYRLVIDNVHQTASISFVLPDGTTPEGAYTNVPASTADKVAVTERMFANDNVKISTAGNDTAPTLRVWSGPTGSRQLAYMA